MANPTTFTGRIAPHVEHEFVLAQSARARGDDAAEFAHLERAHIIGQESTCWHVKAHWRMLVWGWRCRQPREVLGQLLRIAGAATMTAIGLVPQGNSGGANVSPFRVMPIAPELSEIIRKAKGL